jgi:pseudouridine-5'-phosphate glycosidase
VTQFVQVSEDVETALGEGGAVVALETAAVTHGLPREPLAEAPPSVAPWWNSSLPANLALAMAMERAVRDRGATPATIGVIDGTLRIGMSRAELDRLARDTSASKASTRDLAMLTVRRESAGVTVAAALHACSIASPRPIRVLATGGIGGVHRGWPESIDVSADLAQLATTQACVVCSGVKSMLDAAATMELLDSARVPVVGFAVDHLPRFVCRADASSRLPCRADRAEDVSAQCMAHWTSVRAGSAVVAMRAIDASLALDAAEYERAVEQAEHAMREAGVSGPAVTPFLLARIASLTAGRSLRANLDALVGNALLAAEIARALARREAAE